MMFQVLVSTPADVVVLQRPSWWTPRNALVVVALILCSTLVVFGWVAALRNRVKQQTRLLRESEERFRHMALHDTLTGLATRLLLQDRLKIAVEAARRHQTALAFLIVDLDRFKDINDSFGHPAGDEVLRVSANRLLLAVRIGDTVARIGGDEFVVLLPDFDLKATGTIVQKLVAAMAVPIPIEERLVPVTVTIGACTSFAGDMDPDELMRNADTALYIAKNLGRNRFEIFTSEMTGPGILNEAPAAAPGQPRGSSS
jgi:diguanylate cyclase (GGDEF)-like protein